MERNTIVVIGGGAGYLYPAAHIRERLQEHFSPVVFPIDHRPSRVVTGMGDPQIVITCDMDMRMIADNAIPCRPDRTNKKLKNQPYYQRNRNGKMKKY